MVKFNPKHSSFYCFLLTESTHFLENLKPYIIHNGLELAMKQESFLLELCFREVFDKNRARCCVTITTAVFFSIVFLVCTDFVVLLWFCSVVCSPGRMPSYILSGHT